ncbi:hypothetical protein I4F81_004891 [Pyropia yezoensis]|uniref:Uncharacterized protein n=1 Tax=Pyropia yezoensis TaxID=2788 RepID=A0ACC3BXQ5_PYRYE|nr:hypothetical protein I4F81_004891 [Neopyropia yezoensis]
MAPRRPTRSVVTAAAVLVAATAAAVTPSGAHVTAAAAAPAPTTFPRVWLATLFAGLPLFARSTIEAPFEFRLNAAALTSAFDCVGVYSSTDRRYTTWDGRRVARRAPPPLRTDDAMGTCAAAAAAAIIDHLYGDGDAGPLYAAAAAAGAVLPRLNDTAACGGGRREVDITATPGCVGVAAARRYVATHLDRDGMNADGTAGVPPGGIRRPFFDAVSGYAPVNGPAAGVTALTRWVPLVEDVNGAGTYATQTVTAAHAGSARPVLVPPRTLRRLTVPPPYRSPGAYAPDFTCDHVKERGGAGGGHADPDDLCGKARAVVAAGGDALTETQRVALRFFDRKSTSIAAIPLGLVTQLATPFADYLTAELAVNAFTWDALIATWAEKVRHDAVRPASLIPAILPAARGRWAPAIRTMPHQEYPSASAAICSGFAAVLGPLGGDRLNLSVPLAAGSVGGGLPGGPLTLTWPHLDAMAAACGDSRLWGGLHFRDAIKAGDSLGRRVAKEVLAVVACRAPGTPGLPPCKEGGGVEA